MSREDWACVVLIILGIVLFLIGANYYNAFVGYLGLFLFIFGILALIGLYLFNMFARRKSPEDPQEEAPATPPQV